MQLQLSEIKIIYLNISMGSAEEVENSHYWVGEGAEIYGISRHKTQTSHGDIPISQ